MYLFTAICGVRIVLLFILGHHDFSSLAEVASIALAIEMNSVASIALAIEMNGSCNLSFSPGLHVPRGLFVRK